MNTDLKKETKNDFEKDFFKLMNNAVFGKTVENARKQRYQTCYYRKKELFSIRTKFPYYKFFTETILATEMKKKTEILMNEPVYLGLSILELSKILMYEFWYDYVKPKMMKKQSFVIWIQTVRLYT